MSDVWVAPAKRVMALDQPTQKMSKSHSNPKSRVLLTDSREEIQKKLKVALTDSIDGISYDPEARPGVANLIDIAYHLDPAEASSAEELAKHFKSVTLKALKEKVAEVIDLKIAPIRDRYMFLMEGDKSVLADAAALGQQKASESASATMKLVREAVGL
jgi:tryptophanyl-tRNA synthetase